MNFAGLIFVLMAHFICGRGVLKLFRIEKDVQGIAGISLIIGVFAVSLVPCILQISGVVINATSVLACLATLIVLCCVPLFKSFKKPSFKAPSAPRPYEWPFIATIALLVLVSVWRCFYYPPTARDMLTGPELLAEYTVREGTMLNSVYSVDLSTTNNYFKSPFITGLQIVYKLLVCPFGQLWLSVLFLSFTTWMYLLLRSQMHPLVAGFLMLLFITTPTLYGYTYVMLYDYSNMIFFSMGYYFLMSNMVTKKNNIFLLSALLFGIATYIRTETLVFQLMLLPLIIFYGIKDKLPIVKWVLRSALFIGVPAVCYVLCMNIFVYNFVPVHFDLGGQFNNEFGNLSIFFTRMREVIELVFSADGVIIYGFIIFLFVIVVLMDVFVIRKLNRQAVVLLYGVFVIVIGYAVLGYLFPTVVDIANTTKRGLFKAIALMMLYFSVSGTIGALSGVLLQKQNKIART